MAIEFFTDFGVDLILKLSIDNDFPVKDRASIYVLFELGATSSLLDIRKPLIDYLSKQSSFLRIGKLYCSEFRVTKT